MCFFFFFTNLKSDLTLTLFEKLLESQDSFFFSCYQRVFFPISAFREIYWIQMIFASCSKSKIISPNSTKQAAEWTGWQFKHLQASVHCLFIPSPALSEGKKLSCRSTRSCFNSSMQHVKQQVQRDRMELECEHIIVSRGVRVCSSNTYQLLVFKFRSPLQCKSILFSFLTICFVVAVSCVSVCCDASLLSVNECLLQIWL